jgi:hypothetical protein
MTDLEYQKELLKTKIETHRQVIALEMRVARTSFDPLGLALSFFGFDRQTVRVVAPLLHAFGAGFVNHAAAKRDAGEAD